MDSFDRETGEIIAAELHDEPMVPAMQQRMQPLASLDTKEVCTALAKAQGEFEAPKRIKTANTGTYKYSYAPLEEVIRVVQKPMAENGLSRQQYLVSRGGQWFVRTIIWHVSGQWISSDYPIFAEQMTQQKFQSGVTYAKRQGLSLALGLAPEDDDDANVADGKVATDQRPARSVPRQVPETQNRTQGNLHPASPVPASLNDATFDPEKERQLGRARKVYADMIADLNNAASEADLDTIATNARFREVEAACIAGPGPEKTKDYMDHLDRHLAARRAAVRRLPGEMA